MALEFYKTEETQQVATLDISKQTNINGGGNGYYAGGLSRDAGAAAGGGSYFVSGYKGCDAINEKSTKDNIIHTGQPIHYSGIYFYESIIMNGNEQIYDPKGNIVDGNIGNGKITITKLNFHCSCQKHSYNHFSFALFYSFISLS